MKAFLQHLYYILSTDYEVLEHVEKMRMHLSSETIYRFLSKKEVIFFNKGYLNFCICGVKFMPNNSTIIVYDMHGKQHHYNNWKGGLTLMTILQSTGRMEEMTWRVKLLELRNEDMKLNALSRRNR